MTLSGLIDLWFQPRQWIAGSEESAQGSFLVTFILTAVTIPLCTLLGDSVVLKFYASFFFITLLVQFWALVLYFVLGNLLMRSEEHTSELQSQR